MFKKKYLYLFIILAILPLLVFIGKANWIVINENDKTIGSEYIPFSVDSLYTEEYAGKDITIEVEQAEEINGYTYSYEYYYMQKADGTDSGTSDVKLDAARDAGLYQVIVYVTKDGVTEELAHTALRVNQKALYIYANKHTITYGDPLTLDVNGYTIANGEYGFVGEDNESNNDLIFTELVYYFEDNGRKYVSDYIQADEGETQLWIDAGTYSLCLDGIKSNNYDIVYADPIIGSNEEKLIVEKKEISADKYKWLGTVNLYDGKEHKPYIYFTDNSVFVQSGDKEALLKEIEDLNVSGEINANAILNATEVDESNLIDSIEGNSLYTYTLDAEYKNYILADYEEDYIITQKPITDDDCYFGWNSFIYNGQKQVAKIKKYLNDVICGSDDPSPVYSGYQVNTNKYDGSEEYTAFVSEFENTNYAKSGTISASFVINPLQLTFTYNDDPGLVYNAENQISSYIGTSPELSGMCENASNENAVDEITLVLKVADPNDLTYKTYLTEVLHAGSYTIVPTIEGDYKDNYFVEGNTVYTMSPFKIVIEWDKQENEFNDQNPDGWAPTPSISTSEGKGLFGRDAGFITVEVDKSQYKTEANVDKDRILLGGDPYKADAKLKTTNETKYKISDYEITEGTCGYDRDKPLEVGTLEGKGCYFVITPEPVVATINQFENSGYPENVALALYSIRSKAVKLADVVEGESGSEVQESPTKDAEFQGELGYVIYNATSQKPQIVITSKSGVVKSNVEAKTRFSTDNMAYSDEGVVDAGTYYILIEEVNTTNYYVEKAVYGLFEIKPKPVTVNWGRTEFIYNAEVQFPAHQIVSYNNLSNCGIEEADLEFVNTGYDLDEITSKNATVSTFENGSYVYNENDYYSLTARYLYGDKAHNYELYEEDGNLTVNYVIKRAPIDITANDNTITYGDENKGNGLTYGKFAGTENLETSDLNFDDFKFTYTYERYQNINDQTYQLYGSGISTNNYEITYLPGTYTVEKRELQIDWILTSFVYSKEYYLPTYGLVNSQNPSVDTNTNAPLIDIVIDENDKQINANQYTDTTAYTAHVIGLTGEKASSYKLPENPQVEFTITPRPIEFAWAGMDITYNSEYQKPDVVILNNCDGDLVHAITTGEQRNSNLNLDGSKKEQYYVKIVDVDNLNYMIPSDEDQLHTLEREYSIKRFTLGITWANTELIYNRSAQKPTATLQNIFASDVDKVAPEISGEKTNANRVENTTYYTATVALTGSEAENYMLGNYNTKFTIAPKSITGSTATAEDGTYIYNRSEHKPGATTVLSSFPSADSSYTLVDGEYTLSYINNINAYLSTQTPTPATITVEGIGNYCDTTTTTFIIDQADVSSLEVSYNNIANVMYCAKQITPGIVGSYYGGALQKDTEYTLTYGSNVNVSDGGQVYVNGTGNFKGTKKLTFIIDPRPITTEYSVSSVVNNTEFTYNRSAQESGVTVTYGTNNLVLGTDISTTYSSHTNAGTAQVLITGSGNYTGTTTLTYTIKPAHISSATYSEISNVEYHTAAQTPGVSGSYYDVALALTTEYTLGYENNVNAGVGEVIVTGVGNFTGTTSISFTIDPAPIAKAAFDDIDDLVFTAKAQTPEVSGSYINDTLAINKDYSLVYSSNVNAGIASITVSGKGNYNSETTLTFTINPADISEAIVTVNSGTYVYKRAVHTPEITLVFNGVTLPSNGNYTLSYQNNFNAGTATVIATGTGNFKPSTTNSDVFTIEQAPITLAWSGVSLVYKGSSQAAQAQINSGVYSGDSVSISLSGDGKDVGSYTATATLEGASAGNYKLENPTQGFAITPAPLTVSINQLDLVYGNEATGATSTITGFVGGENESVLSGKLEYFYDFTVGSSVGLYETAISASGLTSNNYSITYYTGSINVTHRIVTLDWSNTDLTFTAKSQKPTVTIGNLYGTDSLTAEISGDKVNAGNNYTATVTAINGNTNYALPNEVTTTFNIKPASISSATFEVNTSMYTHIVYTGEAYTPKVDLSLNGVSLQESGNYYLTYENNIRSGDGVIIINGTGNFTGSVTTTFVIKKAVLTVVFMNDTVIYGDHYNSYRYTITGFVGDDTESVVTPGGIGTSYSVGASAGSVHTITADSFYAEDYEFDYVSANLTVRKRVVEIIWGETEFTYNGTPQLPTVTLGNIVDGDEVTATVTGRKTDAGSGYVAAVTTLSSENYELPDNSTGTFNIAKAQLTISVDSVDPIFYGDSKPYFTLTFDGFANGETDNVLTSQPSITTLYSQGKDAGNYDVIVSGAEADNYEISYVNETLVVNARIITITWGSLTKVYDGLSSTPEVTLSNIYNNENVEVDWSITLNSSSVSDAINVGSYHFIPSAFLVDGERSDNYYIDDAANSKMFDITAKEIVISWGATAFTYDGTSQIPSYTHSGIISGDDVVFTPTGSMINAGNNYPAEIAISGTDSTNYVLVNNTTTFNIATKKITITWGTKEFTYDGSSQIPSYTHSGIVSGDDVVLTANGAMVNAGTGYNANITLSGSASANYELVNNATTFDIATKPITITWGNSSIVYNGTSQIPTYTHTAIISGDDVVFNNSGDQTIVGTGYNASITLSGTDSSNYELINSSLPFSITAKEITITWGAKELVYSGTSQVPTYTHTDIISGDDVIFEQNGAMVNAGNGYATNILIGGTDSTNYVLVNSSTTFNITPKSIEGSIISINKTYVYTGVAITPEYTVTLDGVALTSDDINVSITNNINASTNALITITGKGNYQNSTSQKFTINKGAVTFKVTHGNYLVLGNSVGIEVLLNGQATDLIDYTLTYYSNGTAISGIPTSLGTYTFDVSVPESTNYDFTKYENNTGIPVCQVINASDVVISLYTSDGTTIYDNSATYTGESLGLILKVTYNGTELDTDIFNLVYVDPTFSQAGTYAITVEGNGGISNYTVVEGESYITYTIKKATPTVTYWPTINPFQEGALATFSSVTAEASVEGKFSYTYSEGTASLVYKTNSATVCEANKVSMTFTPTDTKNYNSVVGQVSVKMEAVCYIGTTYYGSIETALSKASSGQTVVVRPRSEFTLTSTDRITIRKDCIIKEGVKLLLPYNTSAGEFVDDTSSLSGDKAANVISLAYINSGVNVTVYGELSIGGHVYHTGSVGARGVLMNNGNISIESGAKLNSYGYIKGTGLINAKSGSNIIDVFKIHNWPGGANASGFNSSKVFPFNAYSIHNISCDLKVNSGATYKSKARLYMASTLIAEDITLIGSGGLFQLTSGYMLKQAEDTTEVTNMNTDPYSSNQKITQRDVLRINGDFNDGSVSIKVKVIFSVTISTSTSLAMPIGFFRIRIESGTATLSKNSYAFLPGSELYVGEEATLNIENDVNMIFYDQYPDDYQYTYEGTTTSGATCAYSYQKVHSAIYENGIVKPEYESKLTIDGRVNCNGAIGGNVYSKNAGQLYIADSQAQLNVLSTLEYGSLGSSSSKKTDTKDAIANIDNVEGSVFVSGSTYFYNGEYWYLANNYTTYSIVANANGGYYDGDESVINKSYSQAIEKGQSTTITSFNGRAPERPYYQFTGWYVDAACTKPLSETNKLTVNADGSVTVYAGWDYAEVTINYIVVDKNGDFIELYDNPSSQTFYINGNVTIAQAILDGYMFNGWYTDIQNPNSKIEDGEYIATDFVKDVGSTLTLYGYFSDEIVVKLINNGSQFGQTTVSKSNQYIISIPDDSSLKEYDNVVTQPTYFAGWYTKDGSTSGDWGDRVETGDSIPGITTLYARWSDKFIVTFLDGDGNEYETIFIYPGSIINDNDKPGIEGVGITQTGSGNSRTEKKCNGWDYDGSPIESDTTINSTFEYYTAYKVTISKQSNATVTITYNGNTITSGDYIPEGKTISVNVVYSKSDNVSTTIKIGGQEDRTDTSSNPYNTTVVVTNYVDVASESSDNPCFATGTLVMLSDGSYKKVEELKVTDRIMSFNHHTGKYEPSSIAVIVDHGLNTYQIINLYFDDGTHLRFINDHGLFDVDLMKYVAFRLDTAYDYIGHSFVKYTDDETIVSTNVVKLINVEITEEVTGSYTVISSENLNHVVNDMLAMSTVLYGVYDIFDYDESLRFDEEKMNSDIEKYGLYDYEYWSEYITEDIYNDFGFKYFKVSIGKGYVTEEIIIYYINWLDDLIHNDEAEIN